MTTHVQSMLCRQHDVIVFLMYTTVQCVIRQVQVNVPIVPPFHVILF